MGQICTQDWPLPVPRAGAVSNTTALGQSSLQLASGLLLIPIEKGSGDYRVAQVPRNLPEYPAETVPGSSSPIPGVGITRPRDHMEPMRSFGLACQGEHSWYSSNSIAGYFLIILHSL